jgi:hypothetical protein
MEAAKAQNWAVAPNEKKKKNWESNQRTEVAFIMRFWDEWIWKFLLFFSPDTVTIPTLNNRKYKANISQIALLGWKMGHINLRIGIGSHVNTAMVMNGSLFWDITPYSPLKANWRFGGTFRPPRLGYVPPKRQLTLSVLHGVVYQKIELFITTAVRTSDPTRRYIPEDRTLHISVWRQLLMEIFGPNLAPMTKVRHPWSRRSKSFYRLHYFQGLKECVGWDENVKAHDLEEIQTNDDIILWRVCHNSCICYYFVW